MTCTARERVRANELSDRLALYEFVLGVDVLAPNVGPQAGWTIEATLQETCAPPAILRVTERNGGSILDVSRQGPINLIVTATIYDHIATTEQSLIGLKTMTRATSPRQLCGEHPEVFTRNS